MWMLLRRHRSRLLILSPLLVIGVYLVIKEEGLPQTAQRDPRLVAQNGADVVQRFDSHTGDDHSKNKRPTTQRPATSTYIDEDYQEYEGETPPGDLQMDDEATTDYGDEMKETADDNMADDSTQDKDMGAEIEVRKAPAEVKNRARLLILAYMRTGSSMLGRILGYSPDVFYWYEPLHELERYYVTGGNIKSNYRNLTLNELFKGSAMATGNISAALACDVPHMYEETLRYYFMDWGTFGTRPHYPCFRDANTTAQWNHCVLNATRACRQNFKATVVKTIRLTMSRALDIMRADPKVKVVHLFRDPRAVLLSRHKLGYADFRRLRAEAELLCRKYMEDLDVLPPVGDPLRARYHLIRYEDMAATPIDHTTRLFKLMDITPSKTIMNAIKAITSFVRKYKPCPTCPQVPMNSSDVAQNWRNSMSLEDAGTISRECVQAMNRLGYRLHFDSEQELRDIRRTSAVEPLTVHV